MAPAQSAVAEDLLQDTSAVFERDRGALADPYPIYARLRAEAPVLQYGPFTVVSRYADVQSVLRDHGRFSSGRAAGSQVRNRLSQLDDEGKHKVQELVDHQAFWLTMQDQPDHTRLRSLANQAFTPRRIAAMRDEIQQMADDLLEAAHDRGSLNLVQELAYPLPLQVVSNMLGASADRAEDIRAWSDELAISIGTDFSNVNEAYDALQSFRAYVTALIDERRQEEEGSNLFSALIAAEENGEKMSTQELVGMFVLLLFAGHETTTNLISNSVLALMRDPEQAAILRDEPALVRPAVEEFLRYCTSVQAIHRVASGDTEIAGVPVPAGGTVRLLLASANHDEAMFPDPERLDVRRQGAAKHLGLGFGIHTCLGAWLARLETEIVVTTLLTRYPELRLTEEPVMRANFTLSGPEEVRLSLR